MSNIVVKYWLDENGKELKGARTGGISAWHMDMAANYLKAQGVKLKPEYDNDDVFPLMFKRGFMRVTEEDMAIYVDNNGRRPNTSQRDWILEKQAEGFTVIVNDKAYERTRGGSSRRSVSEAVRKALDGTMGR
jgi:hypothetical protein